MNVFFRIEDTLLTAPVSDRILDGVTRKSVIALAEKNGITTEVRRVSILEIVEASNKGTLKEIFGAGTAAVISPVSAFSYQEKTYSLSTPENSYASFFKKELLDIQYNNSEDTLGWRYPINL